MRGSPMAVQVMFYSGPLDGLRLVMPDTMCKKSIIVDTRYLWEVAPIIYPPPTERFAVIISYHSYVANNLSIGNDGIANARYEYVGVYDGKKTD